MDADTRRYVRQELGLVPLLNSADHDAYEAAVRAFAQDGDQAGLLRSLMELGISADQARWHVANPGRRMNAVTDAPDDEED